MSVARTHDTDSSNPWRPYTPSKEQPWNLQRVAHLHRRAGFAATWNELQDDLQAGPKKSIDRLLKGDRLDGQRTVEFERIANLIGDSACQSNLPSRLKAWWVFRMLLTPDPLAERLALLWHNHFATSNRKVDNLAMMRRQNELFRELGRGPFGDLLLSVVRDPAMLVWLDASANHKGHPNENLARELLELFTLGIGNYGEDDIKNAARALTGWKVNREEFLFQQTLHDDGIKDFIGRRGAWKGEDIVKLLLEHPATSRRLAWRLCQEFLGEHVVTAEQLESLAKLLQENDLNIDAAVSVILRSQMFYADANIRSKVASPAEYVIGAIRALEQFDPPPPTDELSDWITSLGQDLFYPPNVGGWNGGRDWLRTGSMIGRSNFAVSLAAGRFSTSQETSNWSALAQRNNQSIELSEFVGFISQLLFGGEPSVGWNERICAAVREKSDVEERVLEFAISAAVSSPEAHLS